MRAPCAHRARTVRLFAYSVSTRSTMPESELPWLVAGLPVYYHRSNGDRVSATVVGPSPRGGRRVSIRYELGGEEVLYEHAPEDAQQGTHVSSLRCMTRSHRSCISCSQATRPKSRHKSRNPTSVIACVVACAWFVTEVRARCRNQELGTCDKHQIQKKKIPGTPIGAARCRK